MFLVRVCLCFLRIGVVARSCPIGAGCEGGNLNRVALDWLDLNLAIVIQRASSDERHEATAHTCKLSMR